MAAKGLTTPYKTASYCWTSKCSTQGCRNFVGTYVLQSVKGKASIPHDSLYTMP